MGAGIPVISPSNTNPTLTRLGHKNYFRVVVNDDNFVGAVACLYAIDGKQVLFIKGKWHGFFSFHFNQYEGL